LVLSLKAHASILFARAFPNTFIDMLAQATHAYAVELAAISPPPAQQTFWRYVIAQEQAQVAAFQTASKQDYAGAQAEIVSFMETSTAVPALTRK
jgi:hypothetical protein